MNPDKRRSRLSEAREAEILDAALALLGEVGYQGLTMPAVAALARCSTATLYRQWDGKPGLVTAALRQRRPEPLPVPDTGTLRGDLLAMVYQVAGMAETELALIAALAHASLRDDELALTMREELAGPAGSHLDHVLDRAVARGEIDITPQTRRYTHHVMISIPLARHLVEASRPDREYFEGFVDAILVPVLGVKLPVSG
ncbi:MAG: TetR/AcrR family transcriptional regulator [Herbiconiux sp.]|uniref:TetR/AcrR family transcriptional regulator n=1 Tax=Herbiconiux sp. TaxID=1871186 RepID=UPI0012194FEB|nr:TetR/AcrR family transcriptional regulator [Herbiconiux sp.]TAJ48487.1 MAG: TetR/AcrR family transcriptional regulator [Herbiconiux sp.]